MGCGSGILGTLIVIVGVVVFAVISSLINSLFAKARFGGEVACGLYSLSIIAIIVAFVLYEVAFILWQLRAAKRASGQTDGMKDLTKLTKIVTVAAILLSLLFSAVSANVFTKCSDKSISKVVLFSSKEYRWDDRCDVLCYNFSCDTDGNATFTVMMTDGEVIDLFGATSSVSDSFKERFKADEVSLWGYAAYLAEEFASSGHYIEARITGEANLEKVKSNAPALYPYMKRIVDIGKNINDEIRD